MIGWLFWNPNRIAFTLPIVKHPIAWYGILFAFGFFLGYQLLIFLMERFLCFHPFISSKDLSHKVSKLSQVKGCCMSAVNRQLSPRLKKSLIRGKLDQAEKEELTQAINTWIEKGTIEKELPPPSSLMRFAKKYLKGEPLSRLMRRLQLEKEVGSLLRSLRQYARFLSERLSVFVIVSVVVGARLGHLIFYEEWADYFTHPLNILKTWEGGLASHGGIIALFIGIILFSFKHRRDMCNLSIRRIFDLLALPALFAGAFIRMGNFINQEVLGKETSVPWAVIFGNPVGGELAVPRHPAQLYEAGFYLVFFFVLLRFFPKLFSRAGLISGITFLVAFCFRIGIELFKCKQSYWMTNHSATMGQLLSIPLVIYGIWLIYQARFKVSNLS